MANGVDAIGGDLAVVVDRGRVAGGEPGAGRDQVAEVVDRAAAPGPCPQAWPAGDHAVVGDRLAGGVGAEGPQAGHRAAAAHEHAVGAPPVTWPRSLIADPAPGVPPGVPGPVIVALLHITACP